MAVALRFGTPAGTTPGPVPLRFGDGVPPQVDGTLGATLPPPVLPLSASATGAVIDPATIVVAGTLAVALPAPQVPLLPALHAGVGVAASAHATLPPAALPPLSARLSAASGWTAGLAAALPAPALPPLTATIAAQQLTNGRAQAVLPPVSLPPLAAAAQAVYDSELPTGLAITLGMPSTDTRAESAGLVIRTADQAARQRGLIVRPAEQAPCASGMRIGMAEQPQLQRALQVRTAQQRPLDIRLGLAVADRALRHRALTAPVQQLREVSIGVRLGQFDLARLQRAVTLRTAQQRPLAVGVIVVGHEGRPLAVPLYLVTAQQFDPRPGLWRPPPGPGPEPGDRRVRLRFGHPAEGTALRFGCPLPPGVGPIIIIDRREYFVPFDASLRLAATDEVIEHAGFSLNLDADSWVWGWSASIPAWYLDAVRPAGADGFVELIATIHGQQWRLLVESLERERRFGRAQLRIGNRGRSAWLASPHAPIETRYNSAARTAQQLLNDALMINGVPLGWEVDWQIEDWLVTAGAWSHSGTYMDAALRIAEAGGAIIQPHPTDDVLRVLPRYPVPPWRWHELTPDVVLPEAVVTVEGITWQDKPRYDSVYLAGEILGYVSRAGTSGGNPAPMVTDPLLTAPEATRQRGTAILSDTGRQAHIRLSMPVLPELGVVTPGQIVDYTENGTPRRGIARGVDVQINRPKITQTVTVETHELEPV